VGCGDGDGGSVGCTVGGGETRATCSVSLKVLKVEGVGCGVANRLFRASSCFVGVSTLAMTRGRSGRGVGAGVAGGGVTTGRTTRCGVTGTAGAGIGGAGTGLTGGGVRTSVWMISEYVLGACSVGPPP